MNAFDSTEFEKNSAGGYIISNCEFPAIYDVAPHSEIDGCIFFDQIEIGESAKVANSKFGDFCVVKSGCEIKNSKFGAGCVFEYLTTLDKCILEANCRLKEVYLKINGIAVLTENCYANEIKFDKIGLETIPQSLQKERWGVVFPTDAQLIEIMRAEFAKAAA